MRYVARTGLPKSPKNTTAGKILGLWLGGKSWIAAARDRYLGCAAECAGEVVVLECFEPSVGLHLSRAGLKVASVGEFTLPGAMDTANRRVIPGGWQEFTIPKPCELVAIPLMGVDSLWCREERKALFGRICANLSEGGRFVFDARCWGPSPAEKLSGLSRLVLDERGSDGGALLMWETWRKAGVGAGVAELTLAVETVCPDGVVKRKKYARLLRAMLEPSELELDLCGAGFKVERVEGGFRGEQLEDGSEVQFWLARKNGGGAGQ